MRSERRFWLALPLVIAAACMFAGCATPASTSQPRAQGSDARNEQQTEARAREITADAPAAPAAAQEQDPIAGILSERRRGDYPEIELQETGFTITEQVRIGSAARNDYERAHVYLRQDRYDEGIALLLSVIENSPDVTVPYIDLGIAYRRSGDLESAEDALATAALLSPDHPIVHNELAIVYRRTGRFAESRASYERALTVYGDFHYARRNLGVLCDLYLSDLQCALDNYRDYLAAVGNDPEVEIWIADLENRLPN